ncbi:MAG: hypothetical protein ACOVMM_10970 [Chitinophagaceae bacterium]
MKNIKIVIGFFIMLSIAFIACKKNDLQLTEYDLPTEKAFVRFAFFSPGTTNVMVKVNDVKINGAATPGNSGFFPSVINTPDYAAVQPGGVLKLSMPNVGTQNDSVVVFTGNLNLQANRSYSVVLSDTGVNRTLWSVPDDFFSSTDSGFYFVRLINAMVNTPAGLDFVRIDSTNATTVTRDTIARNVAYKSASLPIRTEFKARTGFGFLRYRLVNSATKMPIGTVNTPPAENLINQRTLSLYAVGFSNGTGANAPSLNAGVYNK